MTNALPSSCTVAVIGSGAMGAGIAQIAAAAGHPVKLFDARTEAIGKAIAGIRATFVKLAEKGKMSADAAHAAGERLQAADSLQDLAGSALVVEAIVENLDAKRTLFAELERIVGDDCILATNTSSISVTSIGAGLRLPSRLAGMHFFNPAPVMALVEVISGLATDKAVADIVYATAAAWGKSPVHAKSTPGFIVNRVARPYYAEALRLLTERAAEPATIDAVMREAGGFRMGPFELMDMIGHDVNFAVTQSVFNAYYNDPRFTPSLAQQELVNAGFLGRKSGRGFYRHDGSDAPAVGTEAPQPAPHEIVFMGSGKLAEAVAARFAAAGIALRRQAAESGALFECGGATVCLTDGRSATQRARDSGKPNTVLVDLALDYANATRLALTCADQCSTEAFQAVVGAFQAAGFKVSRLDDVPGMAVMRTVAMLANEAADAVNQGVCSAPAADLAMQKGVNYPRGPLAWADAVGLEDVMRVLDNLARVYGEDRYRVSPLIRRKVASGGSFHA
ncbi:3-hydroxyacyl-CoA dehydrogenase PaaC [Noviherbaspirillum cavernae]|uniref:3-hydroxyacyl-CoA dehydrogenase PaaC n=1 Tax=Noviherbaspirillum cavernae TaxID=2320862 RepID=A0A418X4X5_9BURK|nr:3-hydroxyacyl-CoA dehydrogenase PaaH [Noviherbaspirillum cavernae]RJG07538.1 3-hydroxyacyl-CoA dehydrogenase PaaC [Noviherbaspirillum cavernae]